MTLQLFNLDRELVTRLGVQASLPREWPSMADLEREADRRVDELRQLRAKEAARAGGHIAARAWIDRLIRTDRSEYLDRDDVSPETKVRLVEALDRFNRTLLSYHRFLWVLRPQIEAVFQKTGRRARLLELASGSGEFTLALAALAKKKGLPVDVTGSDIVPEYVERGREAARSRDLRVDFRLLNAFEMSGVHPGDYDLVFIAQSLHHFTPGQLAMSISQAHRIATRGFVGIDGQRSFMLLGLLVALGAATTAVTRDHHFAHDAITTGQKFYADAELELVARIAAPDAEVRVRPAWPGFVVTEVMSRPH